MKKTTASNPLKFFNDAKAARNKSFSKSLIKAQDGLASNIAAGPLERRDSERLDRIYDQNKPVNPMVNGPVVLNPEKINDPASLRNLVENNIREDKYRFNRGFYVGMKQQKKADL